MKQLDWQSPIKVGDVEVPALVGREDGGYKDKVVVPIYGWTLARLPGTNTGHGRAWGRPDKAVEECGGPYPGPCQQCTEDVELLTEMLDSINDGF